MKATNTMPLITKGCGSPLDKACLQPGETVCDLGCGCGRDALKAARLVGASGFVYGVDKDSAALEAARLAALEAGANAVRFIAGAIEQLPLPDASVDVVLSNCVLNFSDQRGLVLTEAYRVLRPQGRLIFADIVVLDERVPPRVQKAISLLFGCTNGVLSAAEYRQLLDDCGFVNSETEVFLRYSLDRLRSRATKHFATSVLEALDDPGFATAAHGNFASVYSTAQKP